MLLQHTLGSNHIFPHNFCAMAWMSVNHQKHTATTSLPKILEEFDEATCVEHAGVNITPESSLSTNCANRTDLLSLASGADYGSLSLETIAAAKNWLGTKSGLVEEKDRGSQLFGPSAQLWVVTLHPLLHFLWIPLIGTSQRLLRRDV